MVRIDDPRGALRAHETAIRAHIAAALDSVTAAPLPPWSDALAVDSTEHFLDRARPEFDSTAYGHPRWFFGADPALPRWTGYTLGYRLVERYQAAHPGVSAAQLVAAPADSFRPLP